MEPQDKNIKENDTKATIETIQIAVTSKPQDLKDNEKKPTVKLPFPKKGQFHVRWTQESWETLNTIAQLRNCNINEAANYLATYYRSYPTDLETVIDNSKFAIDFQGYIQTIAEDLIRSNETIAQLLEQPHK